MASRLAHLVDACAVIAYLKGEPGHELLVEIVRDEVNVLEFTV